MIVITRYDGGLSVKGHSGYAPIGQDIVCAAVSTLVQNFLFSIDALTDDVINNVAESGNVDIWYAELSEKGQLLLDSMLIGLRIIANNYPENVVVK